MSERELIRRVMELMSGVPACLTPCISDDCPCEIVAKRIIKFVRNEGGLK